MTDTITFRRAVYAVELIPDSDAGKPWEREDGHGPVSDWTNRDKRPGEMVLCSDRHAKRYYDFQAATVEAKRDSWGLGPDDMALLIKRLGRPATRAEIVRQAVLDDFERLQRWCDDAWQYVGVVVTRLDAHGNRLEHLQASLWGIESDAGEYLDETARDLIREIEAMRAAA